MKLSAIIFTILLTCGLAYSAQSDIETSTSNFTLNWDASNASVMLWSPAVASIANIHNMKPGREYKLIVQNSSTNEIAVNCFSDYGMTFLPPAYIPANDLRIPGVFNKTKYEVTSDGVNCLINWSTGY